MIKIETDKNQVDQVEIEVSGESIGNNILLKAEATATINALACMIADRENTNKWVVLEEMIHLIGKVEDIQRNNM